MSDRYPVREPEIRRNVEDWLATGRTLEQLPWIQRALASALDLLDVERERVSKARAACSGLGDLATGVLAALEGDRALNLDDVRDAVGDVE